MVSYEFLSARVKLVESDLNNIMELFHQLNGRHDEITARTIQSYAARARLLLARDENGRIAGIASLAIVPKIPSDMGWISNVVVMERERGKGIGRGLVEELIREARRFGVKRVDLSSSNDRPDAHKLYISLGFVRRSTTTFRLAL